MRTRIIMLSYFFSWHLSVAEVKGLCSVEENMWTNLVILNEVTALVRVIVILHVSTMAGWPLQTCWKFSGSDWVMVIFSHETLYKDNDYNHNNITAQMCFQTMSPIPRHIGINEERWTQRYVQSPSLRPLKYFINYINNTNQLVNMILPYYFTS